ncbi:MAG: LURP-one-related family protein [Clostridia bacterium]|nr:LURP-one-related family protein [Clostridia bacterium]
MKLIIKNKILSLGGASFVENEAGEQVYVIKGKIFSPTRKKIVQNMNGETLYKVRNKWFNFIFNKAYIMDVEGNKIAKVTNDGLFGLKVVDYPDNIVIKGGIKWRREITKNGELVGAITRNFAVMRDAFTLEINDNEDIPFFVALVIAMDNIRDKDRDGD